MPSYVQIGLIGAVQRCQPALADLFLRWVGIPTLSYAKFGVVRSEERGALATSISIHPSDEAVTCRNRLADFLLLPEDSEARSRMTMSFDPLSEAHACFWQACKERDAKVHSPLEWWWTLHLLRSRGIRPASQRLLCALFGAKHAVFDVSTVTFENSSLDWAGRSAKAMLKDGKYRQPTTMQVATPHGRDGKCDGVSIVIDDQLRAKLAETLIDLAVLQN